MSNPAAGSVRETDRARLEILRARARAAAAEIDARRKRREDVLAAFNRTLAGEPPASTAESHGRAFGDAVCYLIAGVLLGAGLGLGLRLAAWILGPL